MKKLQTNGEQNNQQQQQQQHPEASCLYALITSQRPVSRRNRATWYLRQLNKLVSCDSNLNEFNSNEQGEGEKEKSLRKDNNPTIIEDVGTTIGDSNELSVGPDIKLVSVTLANQSEIKPNDERESSSRDLEFNREQRQQFFVVPNTRVFYLSKSIATSIILDLSPSVVSVSSLNECVHLDSMFDALKRVLHLLVKDHEIPSHNDATSTSSFVLSPRVFISVIAYTPFIVAKNNQVLVQNRRISSSNLEQVLVEIWICLNRLTQEIQELVGSTCPCNSDFDSPRSDCNTFVFPQPRFNISGIIRQPGSVLEDIFELGLFSSSLMPRLSRLSLIIISDGLFSSSNNLSTFRLKSIAVSFVSLTADFVQPDACFGYTPYIDLMKFISKATLGTCLTHQELVNLGNILLKVKQIPLLSNPLGKLFGWTLHSEKSNHFDQMNCDSNRMKNGCGNLNTSLAQPKGFDHFGIDPKHTTRYFCIDQPLNEHQQSNLISDRANSASFSGNNHNPNNYHDWTSFRQLERNLDADFEQVLACLLREGYLIKNIQFRRKETSRISVRLVLHWRHNLDIEQELTASYWSNTNPFEINDSNQLINLIPFNTPFFGDTYCEIFVHGSYHFLHNLYCDRRTKRRSEFREISYAQYRQLIDGVMQTQNRLQYLSRFYRESSLSKVPSYLLHGNSLFYEQPHTHKLTSTMEIVTDEQKTTEFQEYWQEISCLNTKSWKNLMHIHTLRLVLEHDQPKHKNIHYQNANGRYTHVQCRRALSSISNFIKNYSSFALLEDSTYIKFIYNKDDDLREIETSATKGFIVIRIHKLLPIVVIYLMFTSGILDSHRIQIVSYIENQLTNCKLRNIKQASNSQLDNLLKSKTISSSGDSCCVLIKSPLERMLKVYSRNFINDYLMHNLAYGLPGACPYILSQSVKHGSHAGDINQQPNNKGTASRLDSNAASKEALDGYKADSPFNQYNLVFGKYLYGVRIVKTIYNLPNDIMSSLAANVISKISAILVNIRIKQGFHIAFNNSGILNLVVELSMADPSNQNNTSGCLAQYIVFPPTVSSNSVDQPNNLNNVLNSSRNVGNICLPENSVVGSLNGSLTNSDSILKSTPNNQELSNLRNNKGEIKIIKEYWIEQQYGISSESDSYHRSLQAKRYSEVVDHLFISDTSIFECLLTYDLLQLMCDKLSLYYDLDSSFATEESKPSPIFSPTLSTTSSSILDQQDLSTASGFCLPSTLIEGNTKDGSSKVPLLEMEYKFSITKFLDHCQQASLNVLMFKESSEFYEPSSIIDENEISCMNIKTDSNQQFTQQLASKTLYNSRKMSMDNNNENASSSEADHIKQQREHRSSYQHENYINCAYGNIFHCQSLNHMFLETLHKRLKQMHDKELKLSVQDLQNLSIYIRKRIIKSNLNNVNIDNLEEEEEDGDELDKSDGGSEDENVYKSNTSDSKPKALINWRCFLRKGNQENLMIVLIPSSLTDISLWLSYLHGSVDHLFKSGSDFKGYDQVCPLFVFRCSSSMINDYVMSFLKTSNVSASDQKNNVESNLESDFSLNFGQPCKYLGQLKAFNDELSNEMPPFIKLASASPSPTPSDDKTLEVVHFRAFLRKIKNTVLKSRFSSLNDAYLSELFIHKNDILYYIDNVDADTQKKYHVSSQLKNLSEFIKGYEEYSDSLPKEPIKECNPLLNSILLQKCGLFLNQPIARFNESNPLIKQLHDRKLLNLMRFNYKIELPILEENLAGSTILQNFIKSNSASKPTEYSTSTIHQQVLSSSNLNESFNSLTSSTTPTLGTLSTSLNRNDGSRLMEMKCGSVGASAGSPNASIIERAKYQQQQPRFGGSNTAVNSVSDSFNENMILEAFRGSKLCSMSEIDLTNIDPNDVSSRHEAHMAEILTRTGERKESHQYRRVLKSKGNYNKPHGAIDQALRRVDSLGRLEHFCLTPLLFSLEWRSKLAPVRDHTIELNSRDSFDSYHHHHYQQHLDSKQSRVFDSPSLLTTKLQQSAAQQEADERWHRMVCNNYIKEYEQYIQTLGFNSVQIRYQTSSSMTSNNNSSAQQQEGSAIDSSSISRTRNKQQMNQQVYSSPKTASTISSFSSPSKLKSNNSISTSSGSLQNNSQAINTNSVSAINSNNSYNTGYLIKFLNSGCLVFKVGFCKPYVYSILYSIEGERFNNSNIKMNMTTFLDELDNIKVTMHLHSFTYDYHLRSIYSYISGRQLTFSPGYHLISFLDDFRKYYQKAPNYARNHILTGEVNITNIKVSGQQLYNYIVTHNSTYNMEVLEMTNSISNLMSDLSSRSFIDDQKLDLLLKDASQSGSADMPNLNRNHANDYVLIELKREKVRYRDGKDPDIFDCGLLITHDYQQTNLSLKNSITLKYFLLLTNQRDLYPKLIHTYDSIITLGCHRPIRLGVTQLNNSLTNASNKQATTATTSVKLPKQHLVVPNNKTTSSGSQNQNSDVEDVQSSELQSSGEISGPQSITSAAQSTQSSSSGLQFGIGGLSDNESLSLKANTKENYPDNQIKAPALVPPTASGSGDIPKIKVPSDSEKDDFLKDSTQRRLNNSSNGGLNGKLNAILPSEAQSGLSATEDVASSGFSTNSPLMKRKRINSTGSDRSRTTTTAKSNNLLERTICDEEITYLGYFSSDEMDVLKFLQQKTSNLRGHIEEIVKLAENHYQRDYLWHKLMQRNTLSTKSDDISLTADELCQLLQVVEAVDLASLDPQLSVFTTMHINWYNKLMKVFNDLKQSTSNQHRIYTVKASKLLLLYIDPNCTTALILLSIDQERGSVEMNMLLKDKQECSKIINSVKTMAGGHDKAIIELDLDCQQLINDFINFCATFMWSTFLS